MVDRTLAIRRAILPLLKADAGVTGLVPPGSIYPATTPATPPFPFIRYGATIASPFRASCLDSSTVTGAVHAFTKPAYDPTGSMTATAEDQAHRMAAAIGACIDGAALALEGGGTAQVTWTGSNTMRDGDEQDAWHAVVSFRAEAAG